jgi:hypothetical protein
MVTFTATEAAVQTGQQKLHQNRLTITLGEEMELTGWEEHLMKYLLRWENSSLSFSGSL